MTIAQAAQLAALEALLVEAHVRDAFPDLPDELPTEQPRITHVDGLAIRLDEDD